MTGGAEASLHAFVEGRRTALFRSAYLLCGNRDEAEDLVRTTPRLDAPPLTADQLRELVTRPELLAIRP